MTYRVICGRPVFDTPFEDCDMGMGAAAKAARMRPIASETEEVRA